MVPMYNPAKQLMIHKFHKEFLEYNLNDYTLTFDDGLYNHYLWYKRIIEKYPDIVMIFFISTNIIHTGKHQIDKYESDVAHDNYFKNNDTSSFLTLDQINEMDKSPNVIIGVHGHNHLNIDELKNKYSLKNRIDIFKDDYNKMFNHELSNKKELYYCTPYNQYSSIEIASMIKESKKRSINLHIIGPGRKDIEQLKKEYNANS